MSKIYNVRFNGERATVKVVSCVGDEVIIKSLVANTAEELWQGLLDLDTINDKGQTIEFVKGFDKQQESISLAKAIADWEAKGNTIKPLPMAGKKLRLTDEEEDDILNLVDDLDLNLI